MICDESNVSQANAKISIPIDAMGGWNKKDATTHCTNNKWKNSVDCLAVSVKQV